MGPEPHRFDRRLQTSLSTVAWSGAALAMTGALLAGAWTGVSIGAGAALASANFWALSRIVVALLPEDRAGAEAQSRAGWALVAALKLGALLTAVWLLLRGQLVSPLPMLIGLSALPIGIAIGALVSDRSATLKDSP
ncbi:MAG TPA: ATP synthase subunit I [Polyangiaceae bacterium]|nr:ATP synthase subunit I [Polyangiaceae bacterium]